MAYSGDVQNPKVSVAPIEPAAVCFELDGSSFVLSVAEAEDFIGNLQDALADAARENDAHNIADRELEVARKWWRLGK